MLIQLIDGAKGTADEGEVDQLEILSHALRHVHEFLLELIAGDDAVFHDGHLVQIDGAGLLAYQDGLVRGLVGLYAAGQRMGQQLVSRVYHVPYLAQEIVVGNILEVHLVVFSQLVADLGVVGYNYKSHSYFSIPFSKVLQKRPIVKKNRAKEPLRAFCSVPNLRVSPQPSGCRLPHRRLRFPEFCQTTVLVPEIFETGWPPASYSFGAADTLVPATSPAIVIQWY